MIPMTLFKDIMPYFDKFIHVNGWNLGILWSPLNIWTPKDFTIAKFGHPVSKSWLRPWVGGWNIFLLFGGSCTCSVVSVSVCVCVCVGGGGGGGGANDTHHLGLGGGWVILVDAWCKLSYLCLCVLVGEGLIIRGQLLPVSSHVSLHNLTPAMHRLPACSNSLQHHPASRWLINHSNAEATFIQSARKHRVLKTI